MEFPSMTNGVQHAPATGPTASPAPVPASGRVKGQHARKFTRNPPSEAEQARRKAWGAKYGPLVGESIKQAIREAE